MSSKVKFKRNKIEQDVFGGIKWIVARNNLLAYIEFNGTFKIHTHDRKFQLGVVISHKVKTITSYSKNFTEKEL